MFWNSRMEYNTFNSQYWQNYWILFVTHGFGDSMGRKEIKTFPYKSWLNLCIFFSRCWGCKNVVCILLKNLDVEISIYVIHICTALFTLIPKKNEDCIQGYSANYRHIVSKIIKLHKRRKISLPFRKARLYGLMIFAMQKWFSQGRI